MQLPSGQMLLPFFARKKAQMPPGQALFLRHLLNNLLAQEKVPPDQLGFHPQARFHGSKRKAIPIHELDPEMAKSELKAAYTSPHRKLAEMFITGGGGGVEPEYGGGLSAAFIPRGRLANLDKPPSPGLIRLMASRTHIPERELWETLRQTHQEDDYKIHGKKALTRGRVRGPHGLEPSDKEYHPDLSPEEKGGFYKVGKPTLGTFLRVFQNRLAQDPHHSQKIHELSGKKYGDPSTAVNLLKSLGFTGGSDIDWYYAGSGRQVSKSNAAHFPPKWIKEHHLFDPKSAIPTGDAVFESRKKARLDPEEPSLVGNPALAKLARALGATSELGEEQKFAAELVAQIKADLSKKKPRPLHWWPTLDPFLFPKSGWDGSEVSWDGSEVSWDDIPF